MISLEFTKSLLAKSADLIRGHQEVLLVAGGSCTTPLATPAADVDLFLIGPASAVAEGCRSLNTLPRADVEGRSVDWLIDMQRRLNAYRAGVANEPPPFDYYDLRFLVRVAQGTVIVRNERILSAVRGTRPGLHAALTAHASVFLTLVFQDIAGLAVAGRPEEALPHAGELVQRACVLSLLQKDLVDPSPKRAPVHCVRSSYPLLRDRAGDLHTLLASYCRFAPNTWVTLLLKSVNALVATSQLLAAGDTERFPRPPEGCQVVALGDAGVPMYCLLAIPGYSAVLDVIKREVRFCTQEQISKLAEWRLGPVPANEEMAYATPIPTTMAGE